MSFKWIEMVVLHVSSKRQPPHAGSQFTSLGSKAAGPSACAHYIGLHVAKTQLALDMRLRTDRQTRKQDGPNVEIRGLDGRSCSSMNPARPKQVGKSPHSMRSRKPGSRRPRSGAKLQAERLIILILSDDPCFFGPTHGSHVGA